MAVKSIIDIELNDEQFQRFHEKFEAYRSALAKMPKGWAKVATEADKTRQAFGAITAAMLAQNDLAGETAKREKQISAAVRSTEVSWKNVGRSTRDVAGNLVRATGSLAKWTGIATAFSGLIGAGSLFGLERLAGGVARGRRSSVGLGAGYGEEKAFGINYGPIGDPAGFLSGVNRALHSATDRVALMAAGLMEGDMKGSTVQVGANLLDHLKRIADSTNPAFLVEMMQARKLDTFASLEDMMRLRDMSPAEFHKFKDNLAADAKNLDVNKATQNAWLSFTQQMSRAGQQVENTFVKRLVDLAPALERLSGGFVGVIEKLGDSGVVVKAIDATAKGLNKFADYLNSPAFEADAQGFLQKLNRLGDGIGWLADKFTVSPEYKAAHPDKYPAQAEPRAAVPSRNPDLGMAPGTSAWASRFKDGKLTGAWLGPWVPETFKAYEKAADLPAGTLWSVYGAESSFGRNAGVSPAGAVGPFQFMPATAAQYGVADPNDRDQAAAGAARYLKDLVKQFNGNLANAVAAYNWGPGNMAAYLKSGKGLEGQAMPQETRQYIDRVMGGIPGNRETVADYVGRSSPNQAPAAPPVVVGSADTSQGDLRAAVAAIGAIARQMSATKVEVYNHAGANIVTQTAAIAR